VTALPSIFTFDLGMARALKLKCPTCKKPVKRDASDFPFCSERCRLIDLGKWADGSYVVSTPLTDNDDNAPSTNDEHDE
jgi:endogenous inhibitor of DNA gyrase (YacG/DUF329 family)